MRFYVVFFISSMLFSNTEFKCKTSDTFIKSFNYLSRLKNVDLTKKEIIDFATQLSGKCHDTYKRFDQIFELTEKTDLSVRASIVSGVRVALDESIDVKNFKNIFSFLIKPDGPDLPFLKAMDYAEIFAKKGKSAHNILKHIYNFCMNRKEIALTKEKSIELAMQVSDIGIKKVELFEKAYNYFLGHKFLKFSSPRSIDMTLKLLKYGDDSFEDFKKIFDFALSRRGINVSQAEALELALKVIDAAELTPAAKKALVKKNGGML